MEPKEERRPFHETLVYHIRWSSSDHEMAGLATLIKNTKIPKNHDAIIAEWDQKLQEMGVSDEDLGVPADLLEQKQEAEKEAAEKESKISGIGDDSA